MIVMREQLNVTERAGMKRMKAVRGAVRRGLLAAAALAGMVILTLAAGSGTKPGNSIDLVLREAVEQVAATISHRSTIHWHRARRLVQRHSGAQFVLAFGLGRFVSTPTGTRVSVTMFLHPLVALFMVIGLVL